MKKIFTLFILCNLFIIFSQKNELVSYSSVPPAQRTGAPGDAGTCTGCHSGSAVGSSTSISISGSPSSYTLGSTYTITVTTNDMTMASTGKRGFEMTCLTSAGIMAGSFTNLSTATTITTASSKQYISHNNATATATYTMQWTAPATNVGSVTFYAAGLHANNSSSTAGDKVHTGSLVLNAPASATCVLGVTTTDLATTFQTSECSGNTLNLQAFYTPGSAVLGTDFTVQWERSINFGAWTVETGATALTYNPVLPLTICSGISVRYRPNITSCATSVLPSATSNTTV